eukprot:2711278-Rhodomonas_salina.3
MGPPAAVQRLKEEQERRQEEKAKVARILSVHCARCGNELDCSGLVPIWAKWRFGTDLGCATAVWY